MRSIKCPPRVISTHHTRRQPNKVYWYALDKFFTHDIRLWIYGLRVDTNYKSRYALVQKKGWHLEYAGKKSFLFNQIMCKWEKTKAKNLYYSKVLQVVWIILNIIKYNSFIYSWLPSEKVQFKKAILEIEMFYFCVKNEKYVDHH